MTLVASLCFVTRTTSNHSWLGLLHMYFLDSNYSVQLSNEHVSHQIEMKRKMKAILDDKQFEKWEKMQHKRQNKHGKNAQKKKHYKKQ